MSPLSARSPSIDHDALEQLRSLKFGHLPYGRTHDDAPGDRRRFSHVARTLGLNRRLYQPGEHYDVLFVTNAADLTTFHRKPRGGPKIVFEMVDAYLNVPSTNLVSLVRGPGKWLFRTHKHFEPFYRHTLQRMCRRADLVLCSTDEQALEVRKHNENVHPIVDFRTELRGGPRNNYEAHRPFRLFWEGIGSNALHFTAAAAALRRVHTEQPLEISFVTETAYQRLNAPLMRRSTQRALKRILGPVPFSITPWTLENMRRGCLEADLGIIPLPLDHPLYTNKPENKLLIMWELGLPVVTSQTPAYARTMKNYGGPDWSCTTVADWTRTLREAMGNARLRQSSAEAGQHYATVEHGEDALMSRWVRALTTLL